MTLQVLDTGDTLVVRDVVVSQNQQVRLYSVQIRTTYDAGIDLYAGPYCRLGCHRFPSITPNIHKCIFQTESRYDSYTVLTC